MTDAAGDRERRPDRDADCAENMSAPPNVIGPERVAVVVGLTEIVAVIAVDGVRVIASAVLTPAPVRSRVPPASTVVSLPAADCSESAAGPHSPRSH